MDKIICHVCPNELFGAVMHITADSAKRLTYHHHSDMVSANGGLLSRRSWPS